MITRVVVWSLVGLAFAFALFAVVAWVIAAKTGGVGWTVAGNSSVFLAVAFGAAAAIGYSIHYINHDD